MPPAEVAAEPIVADDGEGEDLQAEDIGHESRATFKDLPVGSLVMVVASGDHHSRARTAIYLGDLNFSRLFLLRDGRWLSTMALGEDASPAVRNFASAQEVAELRQHLPVQPLEVEPMAGFTTPITFRGDMIIKHNHPVMKRLEAFARECDTFRRNNISILDAVHEVNAHEEHFVNIPFDRLARLTLGTQISAAAKWELACSILKDPEKMIMISASDVNIVTLLPKTFLEHSQVVANWARDYQEAAAQAASGKDVSALLTANPITSFIEKSRRVVSASRKNRPPTTTFAVGPSKLQKFTASGHIRVHPTSVTWSDTDKMILDFIWNANCRLPMADSVTRLAAVSSLIIRAIGAYPAMKLSHRTGTLFLVEVGCLAPFEPRRASRVTIPRLGGRGSEVGTKLRAEADEVADEMGFGREIGHQPMVDTMHSIRKDIGDMKVLCIDSPYAKILDDGVSLEPCPGQPNCHWLHLHFAHPTAFFDRNHVFARAAHSFLLTVYYADHDSPITMLPRTVAESFSLRPGVEALTVSTLLNESGQVLDVAMQPTKINNVESLNGQAVEQVMGAEQPELAYLVVGTDRRLAPPESGTVSEAHLSKAREHLPMIRKLDELLTARHGARLTESGTDFNAFVTPASTLVKSMGYNGFDAAGFEQGRHFFGDPTISISTARWEDRVRRRDAPRNFVEQLMRLASESVGKWCSDRNVPAIYVGSKYASEFGEAKLNAAEIRAQVRPPSSFYATEPLHNLYTNLKHQVFFSNPLRRFIDMFAHWNVDAYLLAEAQGKIEPGSRLPDDFSVPWPRAELQTFIDENIWQYRSMSLDTREERTFLIAQAMFRAFHFQEAELPQLWDVRMTKRKTNVFGFDREDESGAEGVLVPFGLRVCLLKSKEGWEDQAKTGQLVPVSLDLVDPISLKAFAVPVGPPSDVPTQTEPIKIWTLKGNEDSGHGPRVDRDVAG